MFIPKYRKAGKKMSTCVFTKDEHVIYASNGICTVEDVKKMSFIKGEPEKIYYILRPKNDKNSTIYIPEDNEMLLSRMRPPITLGELESIVKATEGSECEWIEDRKQRNLAFKENLANPHPAILLPIVKIILKKNAELRENGKKLSAADRDTFETAIRFIKDEFSFLLDGNNEKAEEYIKRAIGGILNIA